MQTDEQIVTEPEESGLPAEQQAPETTAPVQPSIEDIAREKGWKPKEEYEGNPKEWVDADEFVKFSPIRKENKGLKKELQELKQTLKGVTQHINTIVKNEVEEKLRQLQSIKDNAIENGDKEAVKLIEVEMQRQKERDKPIPVVDDATIAINAWLAENKWMEEHPKAAAVALAAEQEYRLTHPNDVEGGLAQARKEAETRYPELFPHLKTQEQKPPPVEGAKTPQHGKPKYDKSRLDAEQKMAYEHMVVRNKIMSHDEYFSELEKAGFLQ